MSHWLKSVRRPGNSDLPQILDLCSYSLTIYIYLYNLWPAPSHMTLTVSTVYVLKLCVQCTSPLSSWDDAHHTSIILKNKRIFLSGSWLGKCIHYFTTVWLLPCICIAEHVCTWIACMLPVLMRIGPPRLHVLGRLTIMLSSIDGTVYRYLYTLPTVTLWLGCLIIGSWFGVSKSTSTHI